MDQRATPEATRSGAEERARAGAQSRAPPQHAASWQMLPGARPPRRSTHTCYEVLTFQPKGAAARDSRHREAQFRCQTILLRQRLQLTPGDVLNLYAVLPTLHRS